MHKLILSILLFGVCGMIAALNQPLIAQEHTSELLKPSVTRDSKYAAKVLFDEAHFNVQTAAGGYKPFVDLLTAEGFTFTPNSEKFTGDVLRGYDILVIAMARGAGPDVPIPERGKPAFSAEECEVVTNWIKGGGSLLLVVDHYPIGLANQILANSLGIDMGTGGTLDLENSDKDREGQSTLVFSRESGLLGDSAITNGRNSAAKVNKVITFAGTSLVGPKASLPILILGKNAVDESRPERTRKSAAGRYQGIAFRLGKGRVVALGEAAMITTAGFAKTEYDNKILAINIMRWLAKKLK